VIPAVHEMIRSSPPNNIEYVGNSCVSDFDPVVLCIYHVRFGFATNVGGVTSPNDTFVVRSLSLSLVTHIQSHFFTKHNPRGSPNPCSRTFSVRLYRAAHAYGVHTGDAACHIPLLGSHM
jgi:hypothetical protein